MKEKLLLALASGCAALTIFSCGSDTSVQQGIEAILTPLSNITIRGPSQILPGATETYTADLIGFQFPLSLEFSSSNPAAASVSPAIQNLPSVLTSFSFNVTASQAAGAVVTITVRGTDARMPPMVAENSITVTITNTVTGNQIPQILSGSLNPQTISLTQTSTLSAQVIDADADPLTYEITGLPTTISHLNSTNVASATGNVINNNIQHRFTPTSNAVAGSFPFNLIVRDNRGGTTQISNIVLNISTVTTTPPPPPQSPTASTVAISGPTSVGLFTGGTFSGNLIAGSVDFSQSRWTVSPIQPNTPSGQTFTVQPNNANAFTVNLSAPDRNNPGAFANAQFGPVTVLVGTEKPIRFWTTAIDGNRSVGCSSLTASTSGGIVFTTPVGDCPGGVKFAFNPTGPGFIVPALSCGVPNCILTFEIRRLDGQQINLKLVAPNFADPTAIDIGIDVSLTQVPVSTFEKTTTTRFTSTLNNPGR